MATGCRNKRGTTFHGQVQGLTNFFTKKKHCLLAAHRGDVSCLEARRWILEKLGVESDLKEKESMTPEMNHAAIKGYSSVVSEFLNDFYRADPLENFQTISPLCPNDRRFEESSLMHALQNGHSGVLEVILKHISSDAYTPTTDFTRSIVNRAPEALELLKEYLKTSPEEDRILCRSCGLAERMEMRYTDSWRHTFGCREWHSPHGVDVFHNIYRTLGLPCRDTDFSQTNRSRNFSMNGEMVFYARAEPDHTRTDTFQKC